MKTLGLAIVVLGIIIFAAGIKDLWIIFMCPTKRVIGKAFSSVPVNVSSDKSNKLADIVHHETTYEYSLDGSTHLIQDVVTSPDAIPIGTEKEFIISHRKTPIYSSVAITCTICGIVITIIGLYVINNFS